MTHPTNRYQRPDKRAAYERALPQVRELMAGNPCTNPRTGRLRKDLLSRWPTLDGTQAREVIGKAIRVARGEIVRAGRQQ